MIYRLATHVVEFDEQAIEELTSVGGGSPSVGLSFRNRAVESAVAHSGYYGRDIEPQRACPTFAHKRVLRIAGQAAAFVQADLRWCRPAFQASQSRK